MSREIPRPFWVTRDRCPLTGQLDDAIDVWSEYPVRSPDGIWYVEDPNRVDDVHLFRYKIAAWPYGAVPDDDRQCVRYD